MIYLESRLEVVGKRPFWSVNNFPVTSICLRKTVCVLVVGSDGIPSAGLGVPGVLAVFVVNLIPCLTSRMCPRAVGLDFGRYLRTRLDVRPGQVANRPTLIASIHVEGTGLKAALCRYLTSFGSVAYVYVLYTSSMGSGSYWQVAALAPN